MSETSSTSQVTGTTPNTTNATPSQAEIDAKKAAKLAKVAEWKRKKELERSKSASASPAPSTAPASPKAGFSMSGLSGLRKATDQGQVKRKMFFGGDSDEEDAGRKPAKLLKKLGEKEGSGKSEGKGRGGSQSEAKNASEKNGAASEPAEVDPLDAYMSSLTLPTTTSVSIADSTPLENLNVWEQVDTLEKSQDPTLDLSALSKRKEIAIVDHSKQVYEDFRRQFYVESSELADMTEAETNELRLSLDGIKIRGKDCPKPISKWTQLGLPGPTMGVLNDLRYDKPTSIQAQAIPAVMSGRDVISVAKTGSGKTLAFLLPMLRHIKHRVGVETHTTTLSGASSHPLGVIITPTRELCVQIYRDLRPFLAALELTAVCAYGGSPIKDQIAALKKGTHIIVCTPGRMIDLLAANQGRVLSLSRVTFLVIDEADRMFDMGFEPQVLKLTQSIRPDRQTVLFSATFPKKMEQLARRVLSKRSSDSLGPIEIIVGARSVVASEITQFVEVFQNEKSKFPRLLEVLGKYFAQGFFDEQSEGRVGTGESAATPIPNPKCLIFVERQESADSLLKELIQSGYPCLSIHGGKEQADRDQAISDFKSGLVSVLIATSVAARGLDVKGLGLVVNWDSPNHMEDYVHRVGRTGRAGQKGTALTFLLSDQERLAAEISRAIKSSGNAPPAPVQLMTERFEFKVRSGTEKRHMYGFSGKGLERLQDERDATREHERRAYEGDEAGEAETESSTPAASTANTDIIPKPVIVVTPPDSKSPTTAYHTTLQINDFPQQARYRASSNTSVSRVIANTGCSITAKGEYYPPGRIPGPKDEPKLFILIEGTSERAVKLAHHELSELLVSGLVKGARYQV
ncbi:Pre-mRNA-processing ATP-dependent RNA helicase PRP5 [Yarrowia lipolytica]|jgi:ATP-dependent RNA helicase DDX46/PRP5|nr:Pre-mRNA-processing ATP-dependent RNA helicase PRP5 [Yarrowia lipolytica]KAE8173923.1 Pre-mRNA-processing ATP-dependent RNA helicase PRP5 [Yarrowia lipolytica]RDW26365.1 Pre-mRNA-processing ATP-dependent RNA helicase PRP5 [Yarrowia lipolytica]RDW32429.1 Pre-mRNA-processing ATP-dependent RNA helicase PRP5 [Yarrowia lipolytica]RDW39499.1 Pre-mRNA-processing ATP-dependent RNA helicase PRP5 [Yarrowia lipolytica]